MKKSELKQLIEDVIKEETLLKESNGNINFTLQDNDELILRGNDALMLGRILDLDANKPYKLKNGYIQAMYGDNFIMITNKKDKLSNY